MENVTDQFGMKTHDMDVELNYNTKKAMKLFLIGSIVLAISFIIQTMNYTAYISEILSIIGTFSIWEFVNTIWFERKEKIIDYSLSKLQEQERKKQRPNMDFKAKKRTKNPLER